MFIIILAKIKSRHPTGVAFHTIPMNRSHARQSTTAHDLDRSCVPFQPDAGNSLRVNWIIDKKYSSDNVSDRFGRVGRNPGIAASRSRPSLSTP